jgi:TPR repeat protein
VNDSEAVSYFRKAADLGLPAAHGSYGAALQSGTGIAKDEKSALASWKKAAELGHAAMQSSLATSYETGRGCPPSAADAFKWAAL